MLRGSGRSAKIAQIIERQIEARVALSSAVEHVGQGRDVIDLVLLVEKLDSVGQTAFGHFLGEVHEHRLDRGDRRVLDLGQELALLVAVGLDRSDCRGGDFLDVLVLADALIDSHITVGSKMFVRPVHNLLLCDFLKSLHPQGIVFPVVTVDERFHETHRPVVIVFQLTHVGELVVVQC